MSLRRPGRQLWPVRRGNALEKLTASRLPSRRRGRTSKQLQDLEALEPVSARHAVYPGAYARMTASCCCNVLARIASMCVEETNLNLLANLQKNRGRCRWGRWKWRWRGRGWWWSRRPKMACTKKAYNNHKQACGWVCLDVFVWACIFSRMANEGYEICI